MIPNIKIAALQYDIVWEDKKANFNQIEKEFLNTFQIEEFDLIVLPEMFATGFTMHPAAHYEDEKGETFIWLKKWAKQLKVHICAGLITKKQDNAFLNTMVFVRPDGKMEYYFKRHLFRMGEENKHYVAGEMSKVVELNGWKINLQICYDLRFPVFARNRMVDNTPQYDLLIYIANWPAVRTSAWSNLLVSRAIENQCYVVGVNRIGADDSNIAHDGASTIIDPLGKYICPPTNQLTHVNHALNYATLERARQVFPVLLDGDDFELTIK